MADQVERKPLREQLEDRVHLAFESTGIPPMAASRMAVEAVTNYYAGIRDEYSDLVAYEAAQIFVSVISPVAASVRQAWVDIVSAMTPAYKAVLEATEMMAKAHQPPTLEVELQVDLEDAIEVSNRSRATLSRHFGMTAIQKEDAADGDSDQGDVGSV